MGKRGRYNEETIYQVLLRAQNESENHKFQWNKLMLCYCLPNMWQPISINEEKNMDVWNKPYMKKS